ncbi:MAG: 3-isopropylmalate dehydratase small subunit [Gammaproteobacteria bacterium]|nr:3-isopropylmalate dehydratase small subunit [Gammaproteobacteria bacterium]
MKPFTTVTGQVLPMDLANVDTDQIIPKQFLKSIRRTGFGDNLFDAWRFTDEGDIGVTPNERRLNHDFVLNQPRYQGANILLARRNFGCGSSREHAVWALLEYGFRCVIAPSFADIFLSNCFKNGLLPVVLNEEIVEILFERALGEKPLELGVDLREQTAAIVNGESYAFSIDVDRKRSLLEGLDDIDQTLAHEDDIRSFEQRHRHAMPWLFDNR